MSIKILSLVQPFRLEIASKNISSKEIGDLSQTIRSMDACWNAENLIEFFEGFAFGFARERVSYWYHGYVMGMVKRMGSGLTA